MNERRRTDDPAFMPGPGEPFFPPNPVEDWAASRIHINAELARLGQEREAVRREMRDLLADLRKDMKEADAEVKKDYEKHDDQLRELFTLHHNLSGEFKAQQGKLIGLSIAIPLFITIILYIIERFVLNAPPGGTPFTP